MTEKMEALLNSTRARLTKLYPNETLSMAMFSLMEVIEEIIKSDDRVDPPYGKWIETLNIRLKTLNDSVTQAINGIMKRLSELEHATPSLSEPSFKGFAVLEREVEALKVKIEDSNTVIVDALRDLANELDEE
jgi:hypothetical protein